MADLSGGSLMVLIQILDEKMWALKAKIDQADDNDASLTDDEDELLGYTAVARELRDSYLEAQKTDRDLPPFGTLVRFGTL